MAVPPAAYGNQIPNLIDTRSVTRVPQFDGQEKNWPEYVHRFESYTALLGWRPVMFEAANHRGPLTDLRTGNILGPTAESIATNLYALLDLHVYGKALLIVRTVDVGEGLVCWHLLKREYEGDSGSRLSAMLRQLLYPKRQWEADESSRQEFGESLLRWSRLIDDYETAASERVSDRLKVATILENAPQHIIDVLRQTPEANRHTFEQVRQIVSEFEKSGRAFDIGQPLAAPGGPAPMDVGRVYDPKGGKGDKGKKGDRGKKGGGGKGDKDKSKTDKAGKVKNDKTKQGTKGKDNPNAGKKCFYCSKEGHVKADCRKRLADIAAGKVSSVEE